ncbi:putative AlkP superfamily pyrophosphatase or phosphodiesterase [Prauserella rugosa]|uniref:Putative AlkP superfamily pyrophosphatase or phosphodiesterase n=2 Tax=Prauserella rugosa TaxID=43354 RepID=A0A660CH25_9PSEU|nr:putative AlkP superfamily pyrophosphatase or phosphodiesterase [Prauserella rugosa]
MGHADGMEPHLCQVTPTMLAALGVPGFTRTLELPEASRACVLLIDGLGWDLLAEHADCAPVLHSLRAQRLSVGYPATTAAGLAAVGTGVPSGEHGMAGYSFAVPGTGVVNALRWCRHPDGEDLTEQLRPEDVQPRATTFERAAAAGVATRVVSSAQFAGSALTRAVLRGGRYVGVHAVGDLAAEVLEALRPPRAFVYGYHSDLDLVGHLYGPGSGAWRMQLRQVDRLVESVVDGLPAGAVLAIVADHGMVRVEETIDLDDEPRLRAGVRAFGGEVRARHVYPEPGAEADVLAAWREVLGDRGWVCSRDEAIAQGWFGPHVDERVRPRIGDVVAAARGTVGLVRSGAEPRETALVGQHGSFTAAERYVPMAVADTTG